MIKIGITGSIASGKTTASKIISSRKGPLFSADAEVKKLYRKKSFKRLIKRKLNLTSDSNLKDELKEKILANKRNFKKIENIIHPLVRKKMRKFTLQNRLNKFAFYEIPLLVESKLMKFFNVIIFIKAKEQIRLKRFKSKGGKKDLFKILNKRQLPDKKKIKFCDHVVVNEKNLKFLKKNLSSIIKTYE